MLICFLSKVLYNSKKDIANTKKLRYHTFNQINGIKINISGILDTDCLVILHRVLI